MTPLTVVYRRVSDLRPDPLNSRTHPTRQVRQIAESIRAFGFVNPILIDETGLIIAGHGRFLGAKKLGLETVPTIELRDLATHAKRALRLADNRIALNAGWDSALLAGELEALSLPETSFDLSVTGFSTGECPPSAPVRQIEGSR